MFKGSIYLSDEKLFVPKKLLIRLHSQLKIHTYHYNKHKSWDSISDYLKNYYKGLKIMEPYLFDVFNSLGIGLSSGNIERAIKGKKGKQKVNVNIEVFYGLLDFLCYASWGQSLINLIFISNEDWGKQTAYSIDIPDYVYGELSKFFEKDSFIASSSLEGYNLSMSKFLKQNNKQIPYKQKVLWGPDYAKPAGIFIDNLEGEFITWENLKIEIENQILKGCPRIIPIGCKIQKMPFFGKENHIVRIIDNFGNIVGDVWFGGDPENSFKKDGLIRIGKSISGTEWIIYQIYSRYSDGSYRLIKSNV